MTIIAYDGRTLATDKRATQVGYPLTVTKQRRIPDGMAAASGDSEITSGLLTWAEKGRKVEDFPASAKGSNNAQLFVVTHDGEKLLYCGQPDPIRLEDRFLAFGSGRDYALAAMHLGHDAKTGAQVACDLDVYCGNGIDTMELP
jgi:hypothetical protein